MEQKLGNRDNKKFKRRLIIVLISLLLSLFIISITVYAAVAPTISIYNTASVISSPDVATLVEIYQKNGDRGLDLFSQDKFDRSFSENSLVLRKQTSEDSKTANASPIVFSKNELREFPDNFGYTYVAFKFMITNINVSDIAYSIKAQDQNGEIYEFNSQIDLYFADENAAFEKIAGNQIDLTKTLEINQTTSHYLVIAINEELIDLKKAATQTFKLVVNIQKNSQIN